jgi:KaiC/GvpD/RAD55 family RecA-like ATPase
LSAFALVISTDNIITELSDKHLLNAQELGRVSVTRLVVDSMSVTLRKQPEPPLQDRLYIQRGRSSKQSWEASKTTLGISSEPSKFTIFLTLRDPSARGMREDLPQK